MPLSSVKSPPKRAPTPECSNQSQREKKKKTKGFAPSPPLAGRGGARATGELDLGWTSASDCGAAPSPPSLSPRKRVERVQCSNRSIHPLERGGLVSRPARARSGTSGSRGACSTGSDRRPSRLHRAPARCGRRCPAGHPPPGAGGNQGLACRARRAPPARSPGGPAARALLLRPRRRGLRRTQFKIGGMSAVRAITANSSGDVFSSPIDRFRSVQP